MTVDIQPTAPGRVMTAADTEHRYAICGGAKRNGSGLCTQPAGWGTPHAGTGRCKLHGGSTSSHTVKAQREGIERRRVEAARMLGVPRDVDVEVAMLDLIKEAAGNVDFYRSLIQELEQGQRLVSGSADDEVTDDDEEGEQPDAPEQTGRPSIAGRVNPKNWEAKPHILVTLYNDERDRLQRYLKDAASLGIQERRVELAEAQGQQLAAVMRAVAQDPALSFSDDQRIQFPAALRRHWQAIVATSTEVTP